jgi:signal transduction histidine kinase
MIREKGLYLKTDGPPVIVKSYPDKLHIILKNLLANAYKFSETGGITVTWGHGEREDTGSFFISVDDTGIGIARDKTTVIFDRFVKSKRSTGQGLGLSIVKELTEVMGGTIEVESEEKKGTRFTVTF